MEGSRVTIGEDRILRVNGKRFFPVAARHMPLGATPALLKQVGFNAIRWPAFALEVSTVGWGGLPDDFGGLMFYPYIYNRGDLSEDVEVRRKDLTDLILKVRNHPALLCYEQRNEPAYTYKAQARPSSPPEGMIAGSRVIRELDPHHPIRVGHMNCNLVSTLIKYNPAVDIVGCNPYLIMAPGMRRFVGWRPDGRLLDTPNQTLSAIGDMTDKMKRVAEGRPVWMQLQAMANENWYNDEVHDTEYRGAGIYEHQVLYPSRWQMRFMAFNAIIRGATGLSWAMYKTPINSSAWQDIRQVIGELNALHEVLSAPVWSGTLHIEYTELGFSDWSGVQVLVKLHEDRTWILAANTQFDPMEATFSNLPQQFGTRLKVFGEDREIFVQNGSFTDRFQPYEVHIYEG
jgi:hypothetical protein